jgi:uncharacterized membrane protein YgcG/tetratricopeptide (TPR) repeat protein
MTPSYRVLRHLTTVIPAVGLFLLISVNPLAQSNKLPAPASHLNDLAGVIDAQTKSRLEIVLQRLKEKSKIELYVATVDSTGAQETSAFSEQLARDWKIGAKDSRSKSLLLVVSVASKTSFTRFSRAVQRDLPEGILGEMSYRMQGPLSEGRFAEAIDSGVRVFANALAEKIGFNAADLEAAPVAVNTPEQAPTESTQPVLVAAKSVQVTRPRTVRDIPKATPEPTPPAETPKTEPTPAESPTAEPTPSESPKTEPVVAETPKTEVITELPKTETPSASRRKETTPVRSNTRATKKTAAEIAEEEADESEEVELTLTLPLAKRAVALKEFLDTRPDSKSRPRAIELLISTHAALGDQKLKAGDIASGIEHLSRAIDEADTTISDQLFAGVISQIPMNLYLRGERAAAFKAAQSVETKFGADPKRLLAVAGFYLGIERGAEVVRIAESAVKLAPELAEAHRILAVGLHISLRLDEAAAEYKRTLELDPASKVSRGSLADLYRAAGKTEEALTLYNEQLVADPKDKAAHAGKVISLFELGRKDEANSELEAALAAEPRNLPLLAGTAYWMVAHDNNEKAFELARKAIEIESRYTWAQIALSRSLLALQRPLDAERSMRFARQYGKFPTLSYELANVLASMGFYDEAAEVLRESFTIKDGQIQTYLAGHLAASESGFLELLALERRAGIYQPTPADNAGNAKTMKALLAFNIAVSPAQGEQINETAAVAAAQDFAVGTDSMRAFRQLYAASRLLRSGVGAAAAQDLVAEARKSSDDALKVPVLTMAVQADEYRAARARAIASGNVPDVAPAPAALLANILKGRLEDLEGWALFNQDKYPEAITHLKQATEILPEQTPSWRAAFWHLGAALEQSGQKEQALDAYIKGYRGSPVESVRRSVIEQLYKSVHGSLDGLEERIGPGAGAVAGAGAGAVNTSTPETATTPEPAPVEPPKSETTESAPAPTPTPAAPAPAPAPESSQPMSEEALRNAASRLRSNIKISGRIVDANQLGLGNVTVVLISPSGSVLASTTDNEGNYSFTVAPSQKNYRVIPSKDGYTFTPIDRAFAGLFDDQKDINFVGTKP